MPKVELHVHLEGSIRPESLLRLAREYDVDLPVRTLGELRDWYVFQDFPHFATIYWTLARCLKTPEAIEAVGREFLAGQAEQNIVHSEVTYTALTQFRQVGIPFDQQLEALNRARAWGENEHGVTMGITLDIPREVCDPEEALLCADWAIEGFGNGITAFGLGGMEVGFPPERFKAAFDRAREAGLPSAPHAGETEGPSSIWGSINDLGAVRLGHGVRCLEDPALVEELRRRQTTLEVCPSSNVRLGVVTSLEEHPLPQLIEAGLNVTLNSDDPPMFGTTLTEEWMRCAETFSWDRSMVRRLSLNAARSAFVSDQRRAELVAQIDAAFVETEVLG